MGSAVCLSVGAQSTGNEPAGTSRTERVLTYGDWYGATTEHLPTLITTYFYTADGKLARTLSGRYQLGDSETTPEVEKRGDIKPESFTIYDYNENGVLWRVRERKYGAVDGYYSGWKEESVKEVYTFDAAGHKLTGEKDRDNFTYTWEGDRLVVETDTTDNGTWIYTKRYADFVEGTDDCPQYVLQTGTYNNYILTHEYDAAHRLVKTMTYKIANAEKDENGQIIGGEKGDLYQQQEWTYDESGELQLYLSSYWNSGTGELVPDCKDEYVWSDEEGGTVLTTYRYASGKWAVFGSPKVYVKASYNDAPTVTNLSLTTVADLPNTVYVQFTAPEGMPEGTKWKVYRNGVLQGEAQLLQGMMSYTDQEVANGKWDYFVQAEFGEPAGVAYVSNIVEREFDTELPAVTKITCLESGRIDGKYAYRLAWQAPDTYFVVKGYNVILNPKSYDPNPPAQNETLITEPNYLLTMTDYDQLENTIIVEAVYNIGFVKSEPVTFVLNPNNYISSTTEKKKSAVYTYGDVLGNTGSSTPSKVENFYYDATGRLVRSTLSGYQLGDDPDTPEVEHAGSIMPMSYNIYDYNEDGRLSRVRKREYGVFSGYDRAWNEKFTTVESYEYDDAGHIISCVQDIAQMYEYTWEGNNILTEKKYAISSTAKNALYTMTFADFVEGKTNLPQSALKVSANANATANNRVYEMKYDAAGHMIERTEYKYGSNVVKDENGVVIAADKGQPYIGETWTYDAAGRLVQYEKSQWKTSAGALVPSVRKVYTPIARGTREESYTYTVMDGTEAWTKSSLTTETVESEFFNETAPGTLTITDVADEPNTVQISCAYPSFNFSKVPTFEVFRNGYKVGVANYEEGTLTYTDKEVLNGEWDYFVKAVAPTEGVEYLTSNVAEKTFDTELPMAQNIHFPINGKDAAGNYCLTVAWDAPETDLAIKGYNVYSNIKAVTANPAPDNGVTPLDNTTRSYDYQWSSVTSLENTFCVEVVYNIGKVKSDNIPVTLSAEPVGIVAVENNNGLSYADGWVHVAGAYTCLDVYSAGGALVRRLAGGLRHDLSTLPAGVYLLKLQGAGETKVLKIVKK